MNVDQKLDTLFDTIDRWLCDSNFEAVTKYINQIDLQKEDTFYLVGLLCMIKPARKHLPDYDALENRISKAIFEKDPARFEKLVANLLVVR